MPDSGAVLFFLRGHFLIVRHLANDKYIVILGVES